MESDAPAPDLALVLRKTSLHMATRVFAVLFFIGTLMGIEPLLTWRDPGAFFTPLLVFTVSSIAARDVGRGREQRARRLFAGVMFVYVTLLMCFAPDFLRLAIGFPLTCLAILTLHLIFRPREASLIGAALTVSVTVGFVSMFLVHPDNLQDWQAITSCVAQVLVLGFANFVLGRLGHGWEHALSETSLAKSELAAAYQISIEASRAKSAFLASMSHELRTPLNAVIGYAELAEDQLEHEGTADSEDLHRIQRAGQHLLDLVNQVLDLSRVESGRVELERTSVDLAQAATEVCDTLRPQFQSRNNQLVVRVDSVVAIELDALRVRQIITNLLGNASKFTESGQITVSVCQRQQAVDVVVEDTGMGIPENRLEQIFEPFEQADDTIQRTHGGTGLGLAISRRLAREMGGDITVSSQAGVGSCFILTFPLVAVTRPIHIPRATSAA